MPFVNKCIYKRIDLKHFEISINTNTHNTLEIMVKFCNGSYPKKQEEIYAEHFEKFPYPLSDFQKHAIQGIVDGQHVLVTAHTGSGKSVPFEFAAEYFVERRKKVIYCSPIKALSNQKYWELTQKFPHISIGVLTGDCKVNPEADVLIMTTEILYNTLFLKNRKLNDPSINNSSLLLFDIDFENELACVCIDEAHYLNDPDRGHVWEGVIMMLPLHIQMVMLSATLDSPEKFALWCETRGRSEPSSTQEKEVWLIPTYHRVVPLTHYSYITATQTIFKIFKKDDAMKKEINDVINKPHVIQTSSGVFQETHYNKMKKMMKLFETKNVYMKRSFIINNLCKYMVENNMLPAICFVLSRKQLEVCAKEVTAVLLEDDSKVPYTVRRECEQIIRKLPNYQEYLQLPEYNDMVSLLEKGIAIHHAGVTPVLREMVELLFPKGYIKLLFATETFALGVNFPIKTVVFTDANKFDGNSTRMLYSHEYTQMAGRAGRRGIDEVGHVIHLNNLFRNVELTDYKLMMQGKPQKLVSKFKISYNLLLSLVDSEDQNFLAFVERSMIQEDIHSVLGGIMKTINDLECGLESMNETMACMRTPLDIVQQYIRSTNERKVAVNKKRKELERDISRIEDEHRTIQRDVGIVSKYNSLTCELDSTRKQFQDVEKYLQCSITTVLKFMEKEGFLLFDTVENRYSLTLCGQIATHIREVHCLVFAKLIEANAFQSFTSKDLVCLFSMFTNITVSDEKRTLGLLNGSSQIGENLTNVMGFISQNYDEYEKFESVCQVKTGSDYSMHYDLCNYLVEWCDCSTQQECKLVLQKLEQEKEIFLGEFVKAILKINNISSEMERVAESIGNIALLSALREIPEMTLKYVATNQSLYV